MMKELNIRPTFTTEEWAFIREYVKVMTPIAQSLDVLQGEERGHLGMLLPTIKAAENWLTKMITEERGKPKMKYCKPLADQLLESLQERFKAFWDDDDCLLAGAFHPSFRDLKQWLTDEQIVEVEKKMVEAVSVKIREKVGETAASAGREKESTQEDTPTGDSMELFFGHLNQTTRPRREEYSLIETNADCLVERWLNTRNAKLGDFSDLAFNSEEIFIDIFIDYNTVVCSSAAVERFFSAGKDILRQKRCSLADTTFGVLMFMRGNRHWWRTFDKRPPRNRQMNRRMNQGSRNT